MNNDKSDVTKAAESVNPSNLKENLKENLKDTTVNETTKNTQTEKPENLDKEQQTPFIDDELRTDK